MKDGFAVAMRRATLLTRGGDIAEAKREIRASKQPFLRLVKPPTDSPVDPEAAMAQPAEATRLEQRPRMRKPLGEILRRLRDGNLRLGLAGPVPATIPSRAPQPIPEGAQ